MPLAQPPNTTKYEVTSSDTVAHIALRYNKTPAELSRLNHLSSSLLYPGQILFVPEKSSENKTGVIDTEKTGQLEISEDGSFFTDVQNSSEALGREDLVSSPDKEVDRLQDNGGADTCGEEISRKYLKIKTKYVTEDQEVVSGVLLVTPLTIIFNPCISDRLSMEHGKNMYVVRLPLRTIARIILFQDIAAMADGDESKQYVPTRSFLDNISEQHENEEKEIRNTKNWDREVPSNENKHPSSNSKDIMKISEHKHEHEHGHECSTCRNFSDFIEDNTPWDLLKRKSFSDIIVESILGTIKYLETNLHSPKKVYTGTDHNTVDKNENISQVMIDDTEKNEIQTYEKAFEREDSFAEESFYENKDATTDPEKETDYQDIMLESVDTISPNKAVQYKTVSPGCDANSNDSTTILPASTITKPLVYVAIKMQKTYVYPACAQQKRREQWFAIPRDRVDQFYNFLLFWLPDVFGEDPDTLSSPLCSSKCENFEEKQTIRRKWSQYSLFSDQRQGLTLDPSEEVTPELHAESEILTEQQINLLAQKLPTRTFGHSWELIYSTMVHGISLATLYRNFYCYDTPVLIVIKDEKQKVFGTFLSEEPKVSEGFFGTGESMLYSFSTDTTLKVYNWTGKNNIFIKGSNDSLAVGGGEGLFGLWLDEELYHGNSHRCSTFENETLSSSKDFICCGLEAWGFL